MNNPYNHPNRTSKTFQILTSLCFLCCLACTTDKSSKTDIPTVRLVPEEASTLEVSDFFDDYKLFEFKDSLFIKITDFVECGDKRVAILNFYGMEQSSLPSKLAIYDTSGHFLYQVGKNGRGPGEYINLSAPIILRKDSSVDVIDLDGNKYLNYSLGNKLNKEQLSLYTRNSGVPQFWFNDSLFLTQNSNQLRANLQTILPAFYLHLYSPSQQRIHKSYLPSDQSLKEYNIEVGRPYKINDTICIYSEANSCIYNIFMDTITPRYYFDKGKHTGFITNKDYINGNNTNNLLYIKSFENNRYLYGDYHYNGKYYYFIYDKKKHITHNYKNVNENIVFMDKKKFRIWPSQSIFFNINSLQANDNYLYVTYTQNVFRNLVETARKELSPEDWENYRQTHPDIIQAYENYDEETNNPVIIGFKYK